MTEHTVKKFYKDALSNGISEEKRRNNVAPFAHGAALHDGRAKKGSVANSFYRESASLSESRQKTTKFRTFSTK